MVECDLTSGCRRRHELGERWGWKVLVEEAGNALIVENRRRGGEFYRELWIGGSGETFVRRGSANEEKLGCVESGERFGERETLMEEETNGEEPGARIAGGCVEEIGARRIEDEGLNGWIRDGEMSCEGGSGASSVRDDLLRGEVAGGGEILPG